MNEDGVRQRISLSHMKAVDRQYWSPSERAQGVNNIIFEKLKEVSEKTPDDVPSYWDLLCWAVEFAGMQALAIGDPELVKRAKELSNYIYSMHYSAPHRIYGAPDRKEKMS